MKKFTAIMMALMMVLTLTQCKPDKGNEGDTQNGSKVKVSCVIPMNKNTRSEFDNLMTDGSIKWSAGTERIYLAIPNETNPQIVEMTAFTTVESNILLFEGEVEAGLLTAGEYEVWYLGNSKESGNSYITEEIEDEVIKSISGSIANQSGDLDDLGYHHIAMTTVTAETEGEEVVLSLNGTLKNKIAIAHLDLEGITNLKGNAIVGTEYALQYNNGAFEFAVTEDASANINVTEGTTASYVVLFPNSTANVDLKSNTSKMVTFEGGVEANKIYYKHVSDMEYYPLAWEDYEEETNTINGHEYVDLGLPSGLLWATCNVGANSPEEYGNYYAWGETTTKAEYTEENSVTYGRQMNDISGNAQFDAATANWGDGWRMPTKAEMQELLEKCTFEWTTENGVYGQNVTGPNGNSIFLPASGECLGESFSNCGYSTYSWISTPCDGNSNASEDLICHYNVHYAIGLRMRYDGITIRPVSGGNFTGPEEQPEEPETPDYNGHEYVDLGLSVKWATCNVGAETPEEYGNYYAWGETTTKEEYTKENSVTYGIELYDLYCQGYIADIREKKLASQHDAATANWGGTWRMPTYAEQQELLNNCTWTWTIQNGVNGCKFTGPSGASIFLPAAGCRSGSSLSYAGSDGYYWSSTSHEVYDFSAYRLFFDSDGFHMYYNSYSVGFSVRPVIE